MLYNSNWKKCLTKIFNMNKVWKYSSLLFVLQAIAIVGFDMISLGSSVNSQVMVAVMAGAVILAIALPILIAAKDQKTKNNAELAVCTSLLSVFVICFIDDCLVGSGDLILGKYFPMFLHLALTGVYLTLTVKAARKIDPDLNIYLTILCSLPLGVGMFIGGVVGYFTKKL